jgi:hypothetical protein
MKAYLSQKKVIKRVETHLNHEMKKRHKKSFLSHKNEVFTNIII